MEIQEAIKVIRALANGMDPDSGEVLKDDSVCRVANNVRALNRALGALVSLEEREQKKPGHAGTYWTRAEDQQVCEELRKGINFEEIARAHSRTVPSVVARLIKLGKITSEKSGALFPDKVA